MPACTFTITVSFTFPVTVDISRKISSFPSSEEVAVPVNLYAPSSHSSAMSRTLAPFADLFSSGNFSFGVSLSITQAVIPPATSRATNPAMMIILIPPLFPEACGTMAAASGRASAPTVGRPTGKMSPSLNWKRLSSDRENTTYRYSGREALGSIFSTTTCSPAANASSPPISTSLITRQLSPAFIV